MSKKDCKVHATEDIWLKYHSLLFDFIRSRVSGEIAEDILQDVFLKVHAKIDSLKESTKLESWLYQITRNSVLDYYRSKRPSEALPEWIANEELEESVLVRQELATCLRPLIKQLPDKYRRALIHVEIEKNTQREFAEVEGISLSGAKSRVQRGRLLLKSILNDCCIIETNHNQQLLSFDQKNPDRYPC